MVVRQEQGTLKSTRGRCLLLPATTSIQQLSTIRQFHRATRMFEQDLPVRDLYEDSRDVSPAHVLWSCLDASTVAL